MSSNTNPVTPDGFALVMAKGIHLAASHLDRQLAMPGIATKQLEVFGFGVSSIFLRAFAAEVALKALYMQETGSDPDHTHDLLSLFEDLKSTTQTSVEQRFERIRNDKIANGSYSGETAPLRQVLANHKNDFLEWRYLHEKLGVGANTQPLVLNSVIEAAIEEYATRASSTGTNQPPPT